MTDPGLGWIAITRIGVVQAAIGMVVVLTTSLLNRVMVVELGLAASVPGALVGLHYALQLLRPRWGHGSDGSRRRTPWIVGGVAVLSVGGTLACVAVALMASRLVPGLALAAVAFVLIGTGVGAGGTALLTLLADSVAPARRPAAAAVVWITMIVGFIAATATAGALLQPFSPDRLIAVGGGISLGAFLIATVAIIGVERPAPAFAPEARPPFRHALEAVWRDPEARHFTWFVVVSMLAYSAQDLILEPFAGLVFGFAPAQTTALASLQNGGTLVGMIAVALLGARLGGGGAAGMRRITVAGCLGSAAALAAVALAGSWHVEPLIRPAVAALGATNGVFAIAAIGLMMTLAGEERAGVRMGVWGAAQAIAFGGGGFAGALAVDAARLALGAATPAYASVFAVEAALFVVAALMMQAQRRPAPQPRAVTA